MRPKVLIIFPKKEANDASHYPYWYKVFDSASKDLNIQYIYEASHSKATRIFLMLKWIIKGYRNIYIHYSYWSVILAKIIKCFTPVTIYYWNCEWYNTKPKDFLLNLALHWSDVLVTGSQSIANQYLKIFFPNPQSLIPKTCIVPNWSEYVPVKKLELTKDQIHILFVHHLSPRKGSRELPTIIKETLKAIPNTHFHIIGTGPDLAILRSSDLANTTFYGSLPLSETRRYFTSCDYFIMPSRAEGFPRVILEAMNYRIPFVATKAGNVTELVGVSQLQFLVDPSNISMFITKLIRLIQLSDKAKETITTDNFNRATKFNLKNSTRDFVELFQN